ncbi:DUF4249 family protein [Neolewinella antarctica]|uniref:DUF4249 family protein n=1 Tax=Neolewinella antarctica TaxID=442734 RepID=A0ABX0X9D0_9BACT|nr:DUF4249 family protein [Neolewinella antarctica]NJC25868.1 hypothetical protein [Neolewinella antarctica]
MNRYWVAIFCGLGFYGCSVIRQEINFELPTEKKMTVYAIWSIGKPHQVFVGNSLGVTEAGQLIALMDATVLIYVNERIVDSLTFENDLYVGTNEYALLPDIKYTLKVSHPAYPSIEGEITIPPLELGADRIIDTISRSNSTLSFKINEKVSDANFQLGYYSIGEDWIYFEIDEAVDSFFPGFKLRMIDRPDSALLDTFSVKITRQLTPPEVPQPTTISLSGLQFVAYRYSEELTQYLEAEAALIRIPLGASELPLTEIKDISNLEGGFGLLSYFHEKRQLIRLE